MEPDPNIKDNDFTYVYTDIETDSFKANQLLQIAAIDQNNQKFNRYINPHRPLPLSVTNFLGIYFYKGELYKNGLRLHSTSLNDALHDFMKWIESLQKPVILIFHNGFNFDCSVLARNLICSKVQIPSNLLKVGDTLPFFRIAIKAPLVENHKLATLARYFDIHQECAHDALSDSETLKQICEKFIKNNDSSLEIIFQNSSRFFKEYLDKIMHGTPLIKLKKIAIAKTAE